MADRTGRGAADAGGDDRRQRAGRVATDPDIATSRLGVDRGPADGRRARRMAATTMAAILERSMRGWSPARPAHDAPVRPARYDYRDGRAPALTGYELANVVEGDGARPRDAGGGHRWRARAPAATSLDGLSFPDRRPAPVEREARIRAMAAARDAPTSCARPG
jgi:uncharacterized protein YggE